MIVLSNLVCVSKCVSYPGLCLLEERTKSSARYSVLGTYIHCSAVAPGEKGAKTSARYHSGTKVQWCQVLGIHIWRPISLATATLAAVTAGSVKANHSK